jgi:hypothetical protein
MGIFISIYMLSILYCKPGESNPFGGHEFLNHPREHSQKLRFNNSIII